MLAYPVVLASQSPRREELLRRIVPEFEIDPADLNEEAFTEPDPWVTAQRLARNKALFIFENHPNAIVIAGDTVVALPDAEGHRQYAKPEDEADARRMLRELSGKTHVVITGVAVRWPQGMEAFTETTRVTFKPLTDEQIADYVATGEPMDKAGAYGAQGMASGFIDRLEGSYENVIGLPIERLAEVLQALR